MSIPIFELPWWGYVVYALVVTHITCIAVTIYLHRSQAHRSVDLHPIVSHFFRFWLWLTTGMITKEWVAVHRKHHAKVETEEDPHSPVVWGLWRVLLGGVGLYKREACNEETLRTYGRGTPDDWIEKRLYSTHHALGVTIMGIIDVLLFGFAWGIAVFIIQMVWIPFWAAGVVNGVGHYFGYRNFATKDNSRNISPLGILIAGEELHNNHHAFASSAKLSNRWFEFDIGFFYIRILEFLRLAKVKSIARSLDDVKKKAMVGGLSLEQISDILVKNKMEVLEDFRKSLSRAFRDEIKRIRLAGNSTMDGLNDVLDGIKARICDVYKSSAYCQDEIKALLDSLPESWRFIKLMEIKDGFLNIMEEAKALKGNIRDSLSDWVNTILESDFRPLKDFALQYAYTDRN